MGDSPGARRRELSQLNRNIIRCSRCPRLVQWREKVARERVKRFADQEYWGKPVPGLGDPEARLLIVGLAPAAHGANRTGRMFTGDRSGEWLYGTLHKFGFANTATSVSVDDGLSLKNCYITAVARCAPPQNKLLKDEIEQCSPYLLKELSILIRIKVIVTLGKLAFDETLKALSQNGSATLERKPKFSHGAVVEVGDRLNLIASFHPSQQNTFTGKLTQPMFDSIFSEAARLLSS